MQQTKQTFFFIITKNPWPPCTSWENTSRKCLATPLNVRSIDSSFLISKTDISSLIFCQYWCKANEGSQTKNCYQYINIQVQIHKIHDLYTSSPASNSACLLWSSSLCSVKFTYWSSAFLFTWLNCFSCSLHLCSILYNSFTFLLLYLEFTPSLYL